MRAALAIFTLLTLLTPAIGQESFDTIITGGKVVDGTGNPWFRSDIGIRGDRIVRIGDLRGVSSRRVINADGLVVAPGFIDPHTHAIRGIFQVPTADQAILQGVTTLTEGNDGGSPYPIGASLKRIEETRIAPNWALFVGQGTIREQVIGRVNRKATAEEIARMRAMVETAMKEGALGISTGLFYVPGNFTPIEEVIALSQAAAAHRGVYISHMRNEAEGLLDSVRETIRIGADAGLPVQITHHKASGRDAWGQSVETLKLVDEARARGVDVTIDQYPYTASQTGLVALLPQWAQEGDQADIVQRLNEPQTRKRIKDQIVYNILNNRGGGDPKNVFIGACAWNPALNGKNLAGIARERGLEPTPENAAEVAMDIVARGGASAIYHAIAEEDVERIMRHPATAIGSDGGISVFGQNVPHPREYGTFARVLGVYVRERRILTLEEAVRKMTSLTAQRLSLKDRGLLREGFFADVTVFDPATVSDTATFEKPHQYAVGTRFVLINGELVVDGGRVTGARPGRVLYGPAYAGSR